MLRAMFGEPVREDTGLIAAANESIQQYMALLHTIPFDKRNSQDRRYIIWGNSFLSALDELEQSQYAAVRYGEHIKKAYIDDMSAEELVNYRRYLYFYRNGIIRIFAILDKLGHFMNERFRLKTEEVKSRFSYFTVLRNMHQNHLYIELEKKLYELKESSKKPVERLRNERNMEIHTINADLLDDLLQAAEAKQLYDERMKAENVSEHLKDLAAGCEMVYIAVRTTFDYIGRLSESTGRYEA
ncbi:hypothetical protein SAMN03159341_101493 [Paenibacillus sp. 1_12]|uniref:Cthe_2314 family HEPN domain-containing protein n=1 Tax=Paenibacillus sp. 1_12 TaxID=1566278 RepID=UPI0008EC02C0|nr:Cthe_2314 family HEPN domain-containing protein [Paenibacillus sp. 1_12]SFK76930.1 hypothetical protein SAMN03159341_101493 [Paenibacillus sp. 1_12]